MLNFLSICALLILNFQSAYSQGENLFNDAKLHEIHFNNMDTTVIGGKKVYQMVDMIFDGIAIDSIGIKEKGNISRNVPNLKVPLKIKTNKYVGGKKYDGIKEFTLHNSYQDPSMMREKITYDICRQMGLFALRTAFAKVYINSVYWGLYTIVEGKDEMFKQVFDNRDADAVESLDFGDMCYISDSPNVYNYDVSGRPTYQLENGNAQTAFPRFAAMISKANKTPDAQYMDTVSTYLNLEHFFIYQAINVYLMNMDSYIAFLGNQIYMYDDVKKIFQIIPWDFNASLALWNTNNFSPDSYPVIPNAISTGCIASRMNNVRELKSFYLDAMCLLKDICEPEKMRGVIDGWKDQIKQAVYDDNRMDFTNQEFDQALETGYIQNVVERVPALKTFFTERYNVISRGLSDLGYTCTTPTSVKEGAVPTFYSLKQNYPNPFNPSTGIDYNISTGGLVSLKIYDALGNEVAELVNEVKLAGEHSASFQAHSFPAGVYFYRLMVNDFVATKKMVLIK